MALVGYARVSSVGQSLAVQADKLKHCNKIYQEKTSGASGKHSGLDICLEYVREEDTLVVTRLDRLARSTLHLCQIAAELKRKQVALQVLDQNIDMMQLDGSSSTCLEPSPSLKQKSEPSGNCTVFARPESRECTSVAKRATNVKRDSGTKRGQAKKSHRVSLD